MQFIAYKYELRPTAEQANSFTQFACQCRFVFNELLRRSKNSYRSKQKYPLTAFGLSYEVTKLKSEFEWLAECHVHCLQESAANLAKSYKKWFSFLETNKGPKVGPPRFKSKRTAKKAFRYKSGVKVDENRIWLPKIGWVRFRNSRDPIGKLKGATVSQNARGKWFVSITAECSIAHKAERSEIVGVDVGLSTFATLSTGEKIENPRWFRRGERKLARLQRSLARKKNGSANRAKMKQKVAVHYERVANRRKDFSHKQSTKLINENQVVSVESLCIAGLMQTRLSKSFGDAGLGEFIQQLEYKAEWYGRALIKADRFFPSTKLCNCCGKKNDNLSLSDRWWKCHGCGKNHDRDINAAINLRNLAVGHTDKQNDSGADVSLASASYLR